MALWVSAGHSGWGGTGEEQAAGVTTAAVFPHGTQAWATKTAEREELRGAHGIMAGVSSRGVTGTGRGRKERKRGHGGLDPRAIWGVMDGW